MTQRSSHRRPKSEMGTVTKEEDAFIRGLLIHEDSEILVFNKPAGLAVQGGSGVTLDLDRLVWAFANRKGRRPKLVHRLDRDTSGIIVVAKTAPAAAHLSAQFAARSTVKIYMALASGCPQHLSGTINTPLLRTTSGGIDLVRAARVGEEGAMAASTDWRVIASNTHASLIEATPHSGRMHQIRAHLAEIGHPIVGDSKYGGLFSIGSVMIPRMLLHAAHLGFIHPASGQNITFDAPLPADYTDVLTQLTLI